MAAHGPPGEGQAPDPPGGRPRVAVPEKGRANHKVRGVRPSGQGAELRGGGVPRRGGVPQPPGVRPSGEGAELRGYGRGER
eukprot:7620387-Pyramimonas_sp.AAC.1